MGTFKRNIIWYLEKFVITKKFVITQLLETFRFEDEDDYGYEIWLEVFSRLLKI